MSFSMQRRQFLLTAFGGACFSLVVPASLCAQTAKKREAFDPRALEALRRMNEAYHSLSRITIRTQFYSELVAVPAATDKPSEPSPIASGDLDSEAEKKLHPTRQKTPRTLSLQFFRPNRFRLEMNDELGEGGKPLRYLWACDGKEFFTYIPEKNYYTREKAPRAFADLLKNPKMNVGSWEILMLMGVNPFLELQEVMDTVRFGGTEEVRGVPVETVILHSTSPSRDLEYRFYIGKQDGLLRRVVQEDQALTGPAEPGKVGDPLDDLLNPAQPTTPDSQPLPTEDEVALQPQAGAKLVPGATKMRIIYEYLIDTRPEFGADAFLFTPPSNALLYGSARTKPLKPRDYRALRDRVLRQQRDKNP